MLSLKVCEFVICPVSHSYCLFDKVKGCAYVVIAVTPAFSWPIKITQVFSCFIVSNFYKPNKLKAVWLKSEVTHSNKLFFHLTRRSRWCAISVPRAGLSLHANCFIKLSCLCVFTVCMCAPVCVAKSHTTSCCLGCDSWFIETFTRWMYRSINDVIFVLPTNSFR